MCLYVDSRSLVSPLANDNSDDLTLKDVNVKEIPEVCDASKNNDECIVTSTSHIDSKKQTENLSEEERHDDKDASRSLNNRI